MDRGGRLEGNVGTVRHQGNVMRWMHLKKKRVEEDEMEFLQPVTISSQMEVKGWGEVAWWMVLHATGNSNHLPSSTFSVSTRSSHPFPDFLPPTHSLPPASIFFSKTDRTRDACESKDERPVGGE